jgi:hypothetical protein
LWPRNGRSFLEKIGPPRPYTAAVREVTDLQKILISALLELQKGTTSSVYELGFISLACRDTAMAAFPALTGRFEFSRHAPILLPKARFPLTKHQFDYLLACRRATTRGGSFRRLPHIERNILKLAQPLRDWSASVLSRLKQ